MQRQKNHGPTQKNSMYVLSSFHQNPIEPATEINSVHIVLDPTFE